MKKEKIFLLSEVEYQKYKDKIPKIRCWWWLRNTDIQNYSARGVNPYGYVGSDSVYNGSGGVRPALIFESDEETIVYCNVKWVRIDDNLYISELPIGFMEFDRNGNDYENSRIKKFIEKWFKKRSKKY